MCFPIRFGGESSNLLQLFRPSPWPCKVSRKSTIDAESEQFQVFYACLLYSSWLPLVISSPQSHVVGRSNGPPQRLVDLDDPGQVGVGGGSVDGEASQEEG